MRFKSVFEKNNIPLLAIDVGTGTQDIFLHGISEDMENCPKFVLPSPTAIIAEKIKRATAGRKDLFFWGSTMGGGPSSFAIRKHLQAGLRVFATTLAAKTIDDDLEKVQSIGVKLVEEKPNDDVEAIRMSDCYVNEVLEILDKFGLKIDSIDVAVAVQDHGEAPKDKSDRRFRFEHLERVLADGSFMSQAYFNNEIPSYFTRMKSLADDLSGISFIRKSLLMDTGTAAVLGALEDPKVDKENQKIIVNVGNGHTLGVSLRNGQIAGIFEHHSGSLDTEKLDKFITGLAGGKLTNDYVFEDGGHGAQVKESLDKTAFVAVTGPKRKMLYGSSLNPYFAVPNGDMMLSGCFGLVRAFLNKQKD